MATLTLDAFAVTTTNHLAKRGAMTTLRKTATTMLLFGAMFLGIGVAAWGLLRAEFEKTLREFPACHIATPDLTTSHGRDADHADA